MSNIARRTHHVRIHPIEGTPDAISVIVSDDGAGLTHGALRGDGLNNVDQRAPMWLGGAATVGPSDPGGTTLHWRVPTRPDC
jgi:signal transduction histidine kinase